MKIIIIGTGWYGLHTYLFLKKHNFDVLVLEKNDFIFNNSSYYNQNRLHLGYHYPRSSKTRDLCLKGYYKFLSEYDNLIENIDRNYYCISKDSFIDFDSYISIFDKKYYKHTFIKNENIFNNIDGDIINTDEKIINSEKTKIFFSKKIKKEDLKFNYYVKKIKQHNNKIYINDDLECDLLIDTTYNQLNLSKKKYVFELSISLLYKKIKNVNFNALTIMDGLFFSLYPKDNINNIYTLTHVKYTPLFKSDNYEELKKFNLSKENLNKIKYNMEKDVLIIYDKFLEDFEYKSYFISYKCKLVSNNSSRECIIEKNNNIISVNCGKIIGIFEFEEYLKNFLKL